MRRGRVALLCALVVGLTVGVVGAGGTTVAAGTGQDEGVAFELLGRYTTGLADPANEVVSGEVAAVDGRRMYVTNANDRSLDVVDVSDPAQPRRLRRVDLKAFGAAATSVAAEDGLVAVAVEDGANRGRLVLLDRDGKRLTDVRVGAGPDMVAFAPAGRDRARILVANEGEPTGYGPGQTDPEGSVSVIDVKLGRRIDVDVETAGFEQWNRDAGRLRARGVRIFGPGATVAQDMEPEYIAVGPSGDVAYVTLQENNAIGVLRLQGRPRFVDLHPLGYKDHSKVGAGLDASDRDDIANIAPWPVKGMYLPDAIAAFRSGRSTYLVTANEGDARDYDGFAEEARARAAADVAAVPDANDNAKLGRLNVTTAFPASGATGQKTLYAYGARSFSIWDADGGRLVWDSGDRIERLTAHVLPEHFNTDNAANAFDDRSDNKGPEPEAAATGRIGGRTYAFVGLERPGGVVVADVTSPRSPEIVQYLLTRSFEGDEIGPDSGPEVIQFVDADDSPTRKPLLIVSHEVTGTIAIFGTTKRDGAGTLSLLHNNDGESSLLPLTNTVSGQRLPVGGVAAFKTLTDLQTEAARLAGSSVLNVYAGDAFLASATLTCSIEDPDIDVYDAVAQRQITYDAHILGNHEFDFTPDFLARFVRSFEVGGVLDQPFLSANLNVSREPALAALSDPDGRIVGETTNGKVIARSAILTDPVTTQRFGVVGATTPLLPNISSPRNVVVTSTDTASTAAVVQAEVNRLLAQGVRKIVLVSHLQDVTNDRALVALLRGVDIAVAGGGDELLANAEADLLPGEVVTPPATTAIRGPYPILQADATGRQVPIVTTAGNYKYLGRLVVRFDAAGNLTGVDASSKPLRVVPTGSVATALGLGDAVDPDPGLEGTVVEPVEECLEELDATPVATTEVQLDFSRAGVRSRQSNGGNLVADAFLAAYDRYASSSGLPASGASNPVVAIQNGGGIRQNAGDTLSDVLSRLDVINVLPFDNTLVVLEGMTPADVKAMLERSASSLPGEFGGFLQIAGFRVAYDASQPVGSRVVEVELEDGTSIVEAGAVVAGAPTLRIVTNNFTAGGGDGYTTVFAGKTIRQLRNGDGLAIPYELGLREYLLAFPPAGSPTIAADDPRYTPYPTGEQRIALLP